MIPQLSSSDFNVRPTPYFEEARLQRGGARILPPTYSPPRYDHWNWDVYRPQPDTLDDLSEHGNHGETGSQPICDLEQRNSVTRLPGSYRGHSLQYQAGIDWRPMDLPPAYTPSTTSDSFLPRRLLDGSQLGTSSKRHTWSMNHHRDSHNDVPTEPEEFSGRIDQAGINSGALVTRGRSHPRQTDRSTRKLPAGF